jgi:hypothetical protein
MLTIKIQVPKICCKTLFKKGEFKVKMVIIPRIIEKETHNSRYLSYDDPRHSQK